MLPILTLTALLAAAGDPQSAAASRAAQRPQSSSGSTKEPGRWAPATRAAPRRRSAPGTTPATTRRSWFTSAKRKRRPARPAEAVETYRRYLREAPDASDRAEIEQRIARLAPGAPAAAAPPAPGAAAATPTPAPAGATPVVPASPDAEKPAAAEEDSGWNRYNITAMVSAGVTVALLGTAAFFGASASSHEGDANRLIGYRNPPPEYASVAGAYTRRAERRS